MPTSNIKSYKTTSVYGDGFSDIFRHINITNFKNSNLNF